MRKISSFVLNNFSLFLFLLSLILLSNPFLSFKLVNKFNVTDLDLKVLKKYLKTKKIELQSENRVQKSNKSLINISQEKKETKEEVFKKIENFKRFKDFIYKISNSLKESDFKGFLMGLKTEKTQKLRAEKRYYTDFGKIKYFNISNDFSILIILLVVTFFLLEVLELALNTGWDFVNYLNLKTFKDLTLLIFSNFENLKDSKYWLDRVIYYYILLSVCIVIFYLIYLILQIKKANTLAKLSSLGLENYRLKVKKNGLLFVVRRGEELDFSKFQDDNLENIRQVFGKYFSKDDEVLVERYKNRGFYIKKIKLQVAEFDKKFLKGGQIYFGKGLKSGDIYFRVEDLTHFLIVGQSGAGKSVFQNLLINQIIFNFGQGVEELYLVDLKGGVEFLQYSKFKNVEVVCDVKQLLVLSRKLIDFTKR